MNPHVLLCGPFKLNDANALAAQMIAGIAQPVTTIGFAEAISRQLRQVTDGRLAIGGAGVIVHAASFLDGHPKFPPKEKDQKSRNGSLAGAEMIDGPLVRGTVTFVLELSYDGDEWQSDTARAVEILRKRILGLRYAGGTLHPMTSQGPTVQGPLVDRSLTDALRALPPGFLLKDRKDHIESRLSNDGELDSLDVLIEVMSLRRNDAKRWERVVKGALTPIAIGYRAIETPKSRPTHRPAPDAPLHVYAESMASVGEWVHLSRILRNEGSLEGFLWRPYADVARGLYYGSATGPVTSATA